EEVRRVLATQGRRVRELLEQLKAVLVEAANKLLAEEVMTGEDLKALLAQTHKQSLLQPAHDSH
ncbi:MAG: hypothetical protein D6704_00145, partial [Nitrospirae bacterium]